MTSFLEQVLKEKKERFNLSQNEIDEFAPKKLTPYDFLIQIADKKTKHPYDKKIAPAFLLLQWFAQNYYTIDIVQAINHLQFAMKDELIYKYLFYTIPKNMTIPKWIKKDSQETIKEIENIMSKYNVSRREALMIKNHKEKI